MKSFLTIIFAAAIFFSTPAHAEIQTYSGAGEFIIADETVSFAKEQAELAAQSNLLEKVCLFVKKIAQMVDHELAGEEIVTISAGILRVIETTFSIESEGDSMVVKSFVTAQIDTDEATALLEQVIKERGGK